MNKVVKKIVTFLLVFIVGLCSINTYPAKAAENIEGNLEFKVMGASVRFVNEDKEVNGIRFKVGIREDIFETLSDDQKANYRLLVMPSQLANGRLEKDEIYSYKSGATTKTTRPLDIEIDWSSTENEDGYEVTHVVLHGIGKSYYAVELTARAYYQEGENAPVYSESLERSYASVAASALDDNNAAVGFKEEQRDALLGVKYVKTGTWDYKDGILTTDGAEETNQGTKIHPLLLDRTSKIQSSQAVIQTSYYVGVSDASAFVGQPDGTDGAIKGFIFGYDTDTKAHMILDFRYRSDVANSEGRKVENAGWYPYLRVFNGTDKGWSPTVLGKGSPLEDGWYDFRISTDTTGDYAEVIVEYKAKTDTHYTTMIKSYGNENWKAAKHQLIGTRVGFLCEMAGQTLQFEPDIKVYNDTVQTRGKQNQKVAGELNADGTGSITGSFLMDYRTTGNRDRHEGITFGGNSGREGYTFYGSAQGDSNRFYIGMWKWSQEKQTWTNDAMVIHQKGTDETSGVASTPGYDKITDAGVSLQENDELLVDYNIEITLEGNERIFAISYWIRHVNDAGETLIHKCTDWKVKDTANSYTGKDVYLYSDDNGLETGNATGDGKTIFYPVAVTANGAIEKSDYDFTIEDVSVLFEEGQRYTNPIPDKDQPYRDGSKESQELEKPGEPTKDNMSMSGDPYILRYNGKFYLYVSNNSWYCTYRCWESLDLIHYTYLGEYNLLTKYGIPELGNDTSSNDGRDLECPWAPEVHYWNGEFYMYTSPHASSNRVFKLKDNKGLPYGDFQAVDTENDGTTSKYGYIASGIDPSIFIDDNEDKWLIRPVRSTKDGYNHVDDEGNVVRGKVSYAVANKLSSMTELEGEETDYVTLSKTGITGDQTEGPFLFKRNGIYYLIATGEQVGAAGYRLNYAYNDSGLGNELNVGSVGGTENWSTEMEPNLILNTEGEYDSYGHGAITIGPNLDSYWFPYHMARSSNDRRVLGINRVEFSGTRMTVIGQDKETMMPEAPDFYTSYFEELSGGEGVIERAAGFASYTDERTNAGEGLYEVDGQLLSGKKSSDGATVELIKTGTCFTAEYNFKDVATDGSFKCLFGGGYVTINGTTVQLYKGTQKLAEAPMLVNGESGWNWSAYHDIIVAYEEGRITVSIDGCTKIDVAASGLGNGAIGYEGVTDIVKQIGGAVFSNQAFGSSDKESAKTVEGSFFASNYYEAKDGEKVIKPSANSSTYKVTTDNDTEDVLTYTSIHDGEVHTYHLYKDATALKLAEGDGAVYKLDVAKSGYYSLESLFSIDSDGSIIKVQIDNETPTCYVLRKNNYISVTTDREYYEALKFQKRKIDTIYLEKGFHTLTVKAMQGDYTAIEYEMNYVSDATLSISDNLGNLNTLHYFLEEWDNHNNAACAPASFWEIKDGSLYTPANATLTGTVKDGDTISYVDVDKKIRSLARYGLDDFTDYHVKVDIKTDAVTTDYNAGILMRLTQPSIHERQTYGSGKGYYVCLNKSGVSIIRFDYNETLVAHYDTKLSKDTYYTLEAECVDNSIVVWLNGTKVLTYIDPYSFVCGAAALYSNVAETYYKDLEIRPVSGKSISDYILGDDTRYQVIEGAFKRIDGGVQATLGKNVMLDRTINTGNKDLYAVQTSFKVMPDTSQAIKGILFNYDIKTGSYMVLDYRYVEDAYRLYVRYYNGTDWADTWVCDVVLNENEWYDFKINVDNQGNNTEINIKYRTGTDEYVSIDHIFAYAVSGRQAGYISTGPNNMQYGLMTEIEAVKKGFEWPDDWSDALNSRN